MTPFDIRARQLSDEACELIENCLAEFTSHPDFLNRHLSAGFLARCLALIRGIAVLSDADLDDLCAVLARVLLEACLLGLYVLLAGTDALNDVMGDYRRNIKVLAERNDYETLNELVAAWDQPTGRLNLEQVAKKLGPLLEATGDDKADAIGLYDAVYRFYSTSDVHGVGAVFRYLAMPDQGVGRINLRPDSGDMTGSVHLVLSVLYTLYFAKLAFDQWGYRSDAVAELLACAAALADLQAPMSPASRDRPS